MIPAAVIAGVLVGVIIGLAAAAWHHARTDAPPPSTGINAIGLGDGRGGFWMDSYHARLMRPILKQLGREVL